MSAAEKIVIDGKEYTREEFRAKLIQNNWSEETDGTVMDALYNSFLKAMENNAANTYETKAELRRGAELYTELFSIVLPKERSGKQKRDILREIGKWEIIDDNERRVLDARLNALAFTVRQERHEADREGFIESMKWGGWDRPGDKEFLAKLYDQRLDEEGNIIGGFDKFLNSLDMEGSGNDENRKKAFKELKELLEKIPEGERTDGQKELLSDALKGMA